MGWLTDLVWEMDAPGNGLLTKERLFKLRFASLIASRTFSLILRNNDSDLSFPKSSAELISSKSPIFRTINCE